MQIEEILAQTCDCHIHFGQFRDGYFSVPKVKQLISEIGIKRALVMPTGFYSHKEFMECLSALQNFPDDKFDKMLWLSPRLLHWMPIENIFKLSNFKAIKIHFGAHPDWLLYQENIRKVCAFAAERTIPVMFHTGIETPASLFSSYCKDFPQTTFILAHGNPINETMTILQECHNVYVDTAFFPFSSIEELCKNNFENKIIFGTDFPITNYFFKDNNSIIWYKQLVENIISTFGEDCFKQWSNVVYKELFINTI